MRMRTRAWKRGYARCLINGITYKFFKINKLLISCGAGLSVSQVHPFASKVMDKLLGI